MTLDANIINFSPLPFYKSADEQNAKRWWIYDIYPLFASNKSLIPFQIIRQNTGEWASIDGIIHQNSCISADGQIIPSTKNEQVFEFDVAQFLGQVKITSDGRSQNTDTYFLVSFIDIDGYSIVDAQASALNEDWREGPVRRVLDIPQDVVKVYISSDTNTKVFTQVDEAVAKIYHEDGTLAGSFSLQINSGTSYDILIGIPNGLNLPIGRYYLIISDTHSNSWISDILTIVDDDVLANGNYVKLEWYDQQDLVTDSGIISYANDYKNVIYLATDLAKPEYIYEEDGENRDGYFFPEKQISKKRYKFGFYAPEYLLDVLRLVRLADYAKVSYKGREYQCSEILLTPNWESQGDVALVEGEFDTNTVVKAVGRILS